MHAMTFHLSPRADLGCPVRRLFLCILLLAAAALPAVRRDLAPPEVPVVESAHVLVAPADSTRIAP